MPVIQCANEKCRKDIYVLPENVGKITLCAQCKAEKESEEAKWWRDSWRKDNNQPKKQTNPSS